MPEYGLVENEHVRAVYEAALGPRRFADPDRTHVVMGVYTTDLSEGRGDVYVAVGLGRQLTEFGYEVVYLGRDDWYDPPDGTDVFMSMLAEPSVMLDPMLLDPAIRRIAWARNNTDRWVASPHLALYDAVLCSSEISRRTIRRAYPGPTGILRIGFDPDLFRLEGEGEDEPRDGVVSTVNQWGGQRQVYASLNEIQIDFPLALYGTQRGLPSGMEKHTRDPASFFALPSLYRQAELVLDDQQDVNRGYGNVNSRIYESLACGALPITNTRLGLAEVGLADLPAYGTEAELDRLVHDLLEDESRRQVLVDKLREVVLAEHTYASRAETLHGYLTDHEPASHPVVAFYPDYRATNPYQTMLYSRGPENGIASCPVTSTEDIATLSTLLEDRLVLHVHWTATVLGPARGDREDAVRRAGAFLDTLDGVHRRGGAVLWTVHNVLPHDGDFPELEADLRQGIADRANAVHVMCEDTARAVAEHYELPAERTRVIPHASYVDVYPNLVDRATARQELSIPADAVVLLFLGQVRAYKGIEEFLDAAARVRLQRPGVRVLVAGNPGKEPGVRPIVERLEADTSVDAHLRVIPDAELQIFLNAADVVVLPYEAALNSGALQLALSFGRPVVAAHVGCLPGSLSEATGLTYRDDLAGALDRAIDRFADPDVRPATEQACYEAARSYDYLAMGADLVDLVNEVLAARGGDAG